MIDFTHIEAFIEAMAKEDIKVRMTIEYDEAYGSYAARMVDIHYSHNVAMLDINSAHYLIGKGDTVEEAIEELAYKVEMQYC